MNFYKLKSKFGKLKETILFNFILIFLTAFFTKNSIQIFKKSLVFKEINSSLLLTNLDGGYRYLWVFIVLLVGYSITLFTFKLRWNIVGKEIKILVFLSTLILTWVTVFSDYNYYENSWFFIDRVVLFTLCILIFYRPSAIFLFLLYFFIFIEQFDYLPFWGFSLTHTAVLIYILMLTWFYMILHKISNKNIDSNILIIVFLGMMMSWYLWAGISKMSYDWLSLNDTYNLFAIRLDYGWLNFLNKDTIESLSSIIIKYNNQIQLITLIIELLIPIVLLVNKRVLMFGFLTVIVFHLSVFFLSGILFWQWILLELAIMCIYYMSSFLSIKPKYLIYCYYFFVLLIAKNYLGVIALGWLDTNIVHKHRFELVKNDGTTTQLNSTFFAPFEVNFAKDKFYFLDKTSIVTGTFGSSYNKKLSKIKEVYNKDSILNYINKIGYKNYNKDKTDKFINFLNTFINNKREIKYTLPVKSLPDIIEFSNLNSYKVKDDVVSLLIINETKKVDLKHKKNNSISIDTLEVKLKQSLF